MKLYFLSGLGADKTVFQLLDLSFCEPVFIDWVPPLKKESLSDYALRIKEHFIKDDGTIVGLSFGAMLATEMAKHDPSVKAILISGAKTRFEIPSWYRTGKYIPVHRIFSEHVQRWFMLRMKSRLGINGDVEKRIYTALIKRNNKSFNAWAIDALLDWRNENIPGNVFHIHGTHDRVLPYKKIKADYAVRGGGHMMIMNKANEISQLLKKLAAEEAATPTPALFS